MKLISKVAIVIATASFASLVGAQESQNWTSADGGFWKSAAGACWRNASWTAVSAGSGCDGALAPKIVPAPVAPAAPALAPLAATQSATVAVTPAPAPAPVVVTKVAYAADALFDFNKSVLKPEGKVRLDDLLGKLKGIKLEVIIVVGHTDSIGSHDYNLKLSVARSAVVRDYLVSKGRRKSDVYMEGKGKKQPVADNRTSDSRARNRRVEIEAIGTRSN
jgi:OOP family OmpA-OmpF porin